MVNRFTLSNRPQNVKALQEFLCAWGEQRGLARNRLKILEKAAARIFQFILTQVYPPGRPGSVAVEVEERGVRTRLVFEDDGPPYGQAALEALSLNALPAGPGPSLSWLRDHTDSVVYYRTVDQKNRLVIFLTL
ncbi:MAG: hypothetical protein ACUVXF_09650 [Desulfobaccales bacterium]